jgi:hypothetical protein
MVVRVAMEVEKDRAGHVSQAGEKALVTTFADVDDALDGHGASLPRPPRAQGGRWPQGG